MMRWASKGPLATLYRGNPEVCELLPEASGEEDIGIETPRLPSRMRRHPLLSLDCPGMGTRTGEADCFPLSQIGLLGEFLVGCTEEGRSPCRASTLLRLDAPWILDRPEHSGLLECGKE